jgi:alpha-L-fucosidase
MIPIDGGTRIDEKLARRPAPVPLETPMPDVGRIPGPVSRAEASSEERDKGNVAGNAFDGDPSTRWCASGGELPQWVRVDLGKRRAVRQAVITWEYDGVYQYVIEGSTDGRSWKQLADRTGNRKAARKTTDALSGEVRYLRVTITRTPPEKWASIFEIEVK